jgi:hypothetical protein
MKQEGGEMKNKGGSIKPRTTRTTRTREQQKNPVKQTFSREPFVKFVRFTVNLLPLKTNFPVPEKNMLCREKNIPRPEFFFQTLENQVPRMEKNFLCREKNALCLGINFQTRENNVPALAGTEPTHHFL